MSHYTTLFTNILDVYGGGGKLLGGTYLILLFAGMMTAAYYRYAAANLLCLVVFLGCTICWWRFECVDRFMLDSKFPFGGGLNPPSISSIIMALFVAGTVFNLAALLQRWSLTKKICVVWSWLGSHTLYIFLYHRYFLDFWLCRCQFLQGNILIKRIAYMGVMIFGSIAADYAVLALKKLFAREQAVIKEMSKEYERSDSI